MIIQIFLDFMDHDAYLPLTGSLSPMPEKISSYVSGTTIPETALSVLILSAD